jgi:uncharacterized membrane protein
VHAERVVVIAAPPAQVWEVMYDVERWPEWTPSVTSVQRLDEGPLRVASRTRTRQPRLPPTTWTVTELSVGESFTWVASGPGFTTTATHRVRADRGGSVVTLVLDQAGALGALVGLVAARLTERYLTLEATGLRERVEHAAR